MAEDVYRIVAPHFVAALVVDSNMVIVKSAPILSWARGKSLHTVQDYFEKKSWTIECIQKGL